MHFETANKPHFGRKLNKMHFASEENDNLIIALLALTLEGELQLTRYPFDLIILTLFLY